MVSINGNAKVNLTLDILGVREDGFHEVAMVMQEISLHDTVELSKTDGDITLIIDGSDLPADETNLAWRAAKLIKDEYKLCGGAAIRLYKRIPIAAGLAGGSADAAAVLKGMNELYELSISEEELCRLGARLGSDIPFCIMGGTMLSTGRGEFLERLPDFPECWMVLAKPPIGVSTAWAYKTYDNGYDGPHPDNAAMLEAIESGDMEKAASLLCNVLEGVTAAAHKEINEYKSIMMKNGAMASMMSGSGPTCFCIARNEASANEIAGALRAEGIEDVFAVKTVKQKEEI